MAKAHQKLDDDEIVSIERLTFPEALRQIAEGTIEDAKTIVGLMLAAAKGLHLERLHTRGKEGVMVSLISAFAVGSIAAFLNAAYTLA